MVPYATVTMRQTHRSEQSWKWCLPICHFQYVDRDNTCSKPSSSTWRHYVLLSVRKSKQHLRQTGLILLTSRIIQSLIQFTIENKILKQNDGNKIRHFVKLPLCFFEVILWCCIVKYETNCQKLQIINGVGRVSAHHKVITNKLITELGAFLRSDTQRTRYV